MAAKIFRINYKSDFILTLNSDAGWMTPFCIKFWTGAPSQAFFVGWDGTTYTHCAYDPSEPTKLLVQFDDHHLPIGDLKFQIAYHFTVADFPNDTEDEVINPASITTEIDGQEYQVMLDFTGETAPEIEFSLPAYANEAQRIANEEQRIAHEAIRIVNEESRIASEETRQRNEATRIAQEEARVSEFARLKRESQQATRDANDAATLANQKAQLAQDKATLAQEAATLANQKAQLAADKAALANDAAQLANEKAALAQQKAQYAQQQGGYAKDQGDYAKDQGDYAKAKGIIAEEDHQRAEADHGIAVDDHTRAESDHGIAVDDHTRAESDHGIAADDHTQAGNDHTRAESDHTRAESDHGIAADDHTRAESDHGIAADDHTQAGNDHTRAESDHTRAESDHDAVELYVDSLGVFDLSKHNAVGGVLATYADLSAALTALNALESKYKYGGMSFKFIQSSVYKYVEYRYVPATSAGFDNTDNWQELIFAEPDNQQALVPAFDAASQSVHITEQVLSEQQQRQARANIDAASQGELATFMHDYRPIEIEGDVTNAPDEEDLTSVNVEGTDVLKLKDKAYAPTIFSGMGRVYLRKNIQTVNNEEKNILTQDMLYKGEVGSRVPNTNTIFVIQYDYVLGEDITVPENCVLEFDGGSVSGEYSITGQLQEIGYPEWYQGNDDDYTAIARCMSICKTVCFKPNKIYNVYGGVAVKENRIIKGNSATINLYKKPGGSSILFGINSNAQIYDLNIDCKENDLQWNRVNMSNVANIVIDNCTITGFLNPTDANAHGLYFKNAHDIIVKNCYIYNTTRDIAITEDCYNLFFHNVICTKVDIEPSEFVITHHIVFKDCTITTFIIEETQQQYSIRDVQVLSSIIEYLTIKGGFNITFNDCAISNVKTKISSNDMCWATNISINNIPLGPELVLNPHLINLNTDRQNIKKGEFCCGYTSSAVAIGKKKIDGIDAIALNPNKVNITMSISTSFDVKPNTMYQLKWVSKCSFLDTQYNKVLKFTQLDAEDNIIETATSYISSESTSFIEYTIYIKTLPECDRITVVLYNGNAGSKSTACVYIQTVSLREVLTAPQATLYVSNSADMGYRLHMENYASAGNATLNFVNDIVRINNIEYICIEEGNPVKWKSNKGYINSGVTASRPLGMHVETIDDVETVIGSLANGDVGFEYFDTTLGKPIYAKVINNSTGLVTWVDATGTIV